MKGLRPLTLSLNLGVSWDVPRLGGKEGKQPPLLDTQYGPMYCDKSVAFYTRPTHQPRPHPRHLNYPATPPPPRVSCSPLPPRIAYMHERAGA